MRLWRSCRRERSCLTPAIRPTSPALDLTREQAVNRVILTAAQNGYLHSAHDCAEGGMLVALAPATSPGWAAATCALALGLLAYSFAADIVMLLSTRPHR